MMKLAFALVVGGLLLAACATFGRPGDEASLRAADAAQRTAVANGDLVAIADGADANLLVNAPNNRVITRDDLVRMVGSGEIRNEVFERTPEIVRITGDIGVVMGHEVVRSPPTAEQGRLYGSGQLSRRYTNIYIRRHGRWLHIARHANVVPPHQ